MGMFSSDSKVVELEMADGSIETINLADMAKVKGLTSLVKQLLNIQKTFNVDTEALKDSEEDDIDGFIKLFDYAFDLFDKLKEELEQVFGDGFALRISGVEVPGIEFYTKFCDYLAPHIADVMNTGSEFASDEVISADIVSLYGESNDGRDVTW